MEKLLIALAIAGASFLLGHQVGTWRGQEALHACERERDSWKTKAESATALADQESEHRKKLAAAVRKRIERIGNEPVAVRVRIEDRYVYLPDNASCVVRLTPGSDEAPTIAGTGDSGPAAVLNVSGISEAYERARQRINALDGFEGRIKVIPYKSGAPD